MIRLLFNPNSEIALDRLESRGNILLASKQMSFVAIGKKLKIIKGAFLDFTGDCECMGFKQSPIFCGIGVFRPFPTL
jgi:hypothetical protein